MPKLTELTMRMLSEGFASEDTPSGVKPYSKYDGGWTYTPEAQATLTFETPCGLLVEGNHFSNGYMSYAGID